MVKVKFLFILLLLLLPTVSATSFIDRLLSKESAENGICDDGECVLFDKDCKLTVESLFCEKDCFLTQMWFMRVMLIIGAVLLYKHRKNLNVLTALAIITVVYLILRLK